MASQLSDLNAVLYTASATGHPVCSRLPAEIVGSNLTGGMDVCHVLSGRGLYDELITLQRCPTDCGTLRVI
jgi:hypothetical protein